MELVRAVAVAIAILCLVSIGLDVSVLRTASELISGTAPSSAVGDQADCTNVVTGCCCFRPFENLAARFTHEFWEEMRKNHSRVLQWTGRELDDWKSITSQWAWNAATHQFDALDCSTLWELHVLTQNTGRDLREYMDALQNGESSKFPPYRPDRPNLPRILNLGDSISVGIANNAFKLYSKKSSMVDDQANFHVPPRNCGTFSKYDTGLHDWLGTCPWDLVQFNVGAHFNPEDPSLEPNASWHKEYEQGLAKIIQTIRFHSPHAHIVMAMTTPSPLDSNETTPDRETCPHYDLLNKAGFVPALNHVATKVAKDLGATVNDRYSAVLSGLRQYQWPCDIHFTPEGKRFLARHDMAVYASLLHPTTSQS